MGGGHAKKWPVKKRGRGGWSSKSMRVGSRCNDGQGIGTIFSSGKKKKCIIDVSFEERCKQVSFLFFFSSQRGVIRIVVPHISRRLSIM